MFVACVAAALESELAFGADFICVARRAPLRDGLRIIHERVAPCFSDLPEVLWCGLSPTIRTET